MYGGGNPTIVAGAAPGHELTGAHKSTCKLSVTPRNLELGGLHIARDLEPLSQPCY